MAAGYATARPPIHALILQHARGCFPRPVLCALDVGCGAGLSTRALHGFAGRCIGMEPVEAMLRWSATVAPSCEFVVGVAEAIPLAAGSVDLITAAGSLNYVDLISFFPEAARVLTAQGVVVVYDFSPGIRFREGSGLQEWFSRFQRRYPPPLNEARALDPAILAQLDYGFRVRKHNHIEVGVELSPRFYLDYMMTETNVAFAVRNGVPRDEIRSWCEDTLGPVWGGKKREILFSGYFACMTLDRD